MKVEDVMTKILLIDTLIEDVARGALTELTSGKLVDVLDEYKAILQGMEISSSQRLKPDIWEDDYGTF